MTRSSITYIDLIFDRITFVLRIGKDCAENFTYCDVCGRVNADTSERIGESSSRSYFSVESINSALNSVAEACFVDVQIHSKDDFEIDDDACSPCSTFDPDANILHDFNNFFLENDTGEMVVSRDMNEPNGGEEIVAIAEPKVVNKKQLSKRRKKLSSG